MSPWLHKVHQFENVSILVVQVDFLDVCSLAKRRFALLWQVLWVLIEWGCAANFDRLIEFGLRFAHLVHNYFGWQIVGGSSGGLANLRGIWANFWRRNLRFCDALRHIQTRFFLLFLNARLSRANFSGFHCGFDGSLPRLFALFSLLLDLLVYKGEIVDNQLNFVPLVQSSFVFEKFAADGRRCQRGHIVFSFGHNRLFLLKKFAFHFFKVNFLFWLYHLIVCFLDIFRGGRLFSLIFYYFLCVFVLIFIVFFLFVLDYLLLNEHFLVEVLKTGVVFLRSWHFQLKRVRDLLNNLPFVLHIFNQFVHILNH